MPAYLVAIVAVHDPQTYLKYAAHTPALIARHGGKFLTRGNPVTTLEGLPFKDRMVILEFPTQAHVEAFSTIRTMRRPPFSAASRPSRRSSSRKAPRSQASLIRTYKAKRDACSGRGRDEQLLHRGDVSSP